MKKKVFISLLLILILTISSTREKPSRKFFEDFRKSSSKYFSPNIRHSGTEDRYAFGKKSSIEPGISTLKFMIDPDDPAGAGKGPEIISKNFTHFGTYTARLKIPDVTKVQPNAGIVVGYFTYHMEADAGLSEIDWEWLAADPEIIYIGTWTGQRGKLKRIGRTLNMAKGTIINTSYRERPGETTMPLEGLQNQPETIPEIEGYNASKRFYTYGFDWYNDEVRWWIIHPVTADTVVLWDYKGSQVGIPQNHTHYRLNFWYTKDWPVEGNPSSIERPLHRYELECDWMLYTPIKKESDIKW